MNIILFGFKRCGKTYYGMKASQKLHMDFIDSDHLIEELYEKAYHENLSYREIAKKHGFPFFRDLEKHAVSLLSQKKNTLISLGGGVVLDPDNVLRLQEIGLLIYLKTPKNILKQRILSHDIPAYINPLHPEASFNSLYEERVLIYEKIKAHVIDTQDKTEEQVIAEISACAKPHFKHKP